MTYYILCMLPTYPLCVAARCVIGTGPAPLPAEAKVVVHIGTNNLGTGHLPNATADGTVLVHVGPLAANPYGPLASTHTPPRALLAPPLVTVLWRARTLRPTVVWRARTPKLSPPLHACHGCALASSPPAARRGARGRGVAPGQHQGVGRPAADSSARGRGADPP